MYSKVLVPLDGSSNAEVVLPHVEMLAQAFDSEVILFRAIPHPQGVTDEMGRQIITVDAAIDSAMSEAHSYLQEVAARLKNKGVKSIRHQVEIGNPAELIIDFANGSGVRIIAMATHGRSGISRWVYGSVAERVLRHATVPVLLVRVQGQ
ncbi:MAG: universal stress protein [Dehalococcoidia bacterium]|nr:universal stress protein [Dehalococcoidia bacterium]